MATLENIIRPASYKGVPFGVIDAQDARGRNTVTHEFPLRDKVFLEDMGRAKRTIQLTAFVIGPGFAAKRDALIAVLEEPGPGTLVHPWLGTFQVSLSAPATVTHNASEVGYVAFQLQFTEDSVAEAPAPGLDWPFLSSGYRLGAEAEACRGLDSSFILTPIFEDSLAEGLAWAEGLGPAMGKIYGQGERFGAMPDHVTGFIARIKKVGGLSSLVKGFWPARDYQSLGGARARLDATGLLERALSITTEPIPGGLGTVRRQLAVNRLATLNFDREMSGLSGLGATAYAMPESSSDAERLRDLCTRAVDHLLNYATSDEYFRVIRKLHVSSQRALSDAAGRAPTVVVRETQKVGPALALAWSQVLVDTEKGTLESVYADMVKRNGVTNPGFVPAGQLEVLRG
jgi:hypothetical protein